SAHVHPPSSFKQQCSPQGEHPRTEVARATAPHASQPCKSAQIRASAHFFEHGNGRLLVSTLSQDCGNEILLALAESPIFRLQADRTGQKRTFWGHGQTVDEISRR